MSVRLRLRKSGLESLIQFYILEHKSDNEDKSDNKKNNLFCICFAFLLRFFQLFLHSHFITEDSTVICLPVQAFLQMMIMKMQQ